MRRSVLHGPRQAWLRVSRWLTAGGLQGLLWLLGRRRGAAPVPQSGRLLYVAASALPYHISGYATRTQGVIQALQAAGVAVVALTRPGYPWDRRDRRQDAISDTTEVGAVMYRHLTSPLNRWPVIFYVPLAARRIARVAREQKVAVIHAASNHVNALPALLAARALGIPFQYEMRGLWELTRVSRTPGYEGSQAYRQGLQLEGLVARHADRLFVISDQLGRYVVEHFGVDARRMALLPNCVEPERFAVGSPDTREPWTVGYAGSLIGYEGLDVLVDAVHRMTQGGQRVSVRIMGDGEARPQLEAQVRRLGLQASVQFLGKIPPAQARQALASCTLVCIPRKPYQVCRIVPPIKLVEALAMGLPVIVPDLPVFCDELGAAPPGWFFRAGDAADLARVLNLALGDPAVLAAKRQQARSYALAHRSWRDFVAQLAPTAGGVS